MKVKAVRSFKLSGRTIQAGQVLTLPENVVHFLGDRLTPVGDDPLVDEYKRLLRRYHEIDRDESATMDEVRQLVDRLDELHREIAPQDGELKNSSPSVDVSTLPERNPFIEGGYQTLAEMREAQEARP
jgi:hypothetical protein